MKKIPTGTVTFLFTDLEGSTQLWEQHPEAMKAALAQHDAILRQAIERHGGTLIKMTGDGVHAAFPAALGGVAATLAVQGRLQAPLANLPIRVRMALHTGEAEAREGDYFGQALNRAARLMSIASGGQVLLSATTADLVRDQLPEGAALHDLGEHRLKDLVRPEHVYQLNGPGLPHDFPPLRSLNALPHNLPVQLTSFIGREKEIAEVKHLLTKAHPGAARLVTLTGPGGTGKTRLSLQVAADLLDDFSAGAWLVELAPLSDPALAPQTVASALGVREQPDRALMDTLQDYLRAKGLLLILDNCEHLVEASAQLASTLLRACPRLKILASSREALGVTGETVYRVPSLSLPDAGHSTPEALTQCEAARLFVERAQSAQPRFALTRHNLGAVVQICQRLDGIPLAIELAAARVKVFSAEQIAARLDDRFRLLTGGSRTALPRQQTLRALIDWSYDLLSEPERMALWRLSIFAGGWTFDAAEAVIGPEALELLPHLVDKSLVIMEEADAGEARYRLLETVRQYAREKIAESGEASSIRDRHLHYFLRMAEETEPKLEGPEMLRAFKLLETELDNIRTALDWSLDRNPEAGLRLATSVATLGRRGLATEWLGRVRDMFARFEALPPREGPAERTRLALRAKGLWAVGLLTFGLGRDEAARRLLEESATVARESGAQWTLANALSALLAVAGRHGDFQSMRIVLNEGLVLCRATHYKFGLAQFLAGQAFLERHQGDLAAADVHTEEALRLLRELGNLYQLAMSIMVFGFGDSAQGDHASARARLEESERLFWQMGERQFATVVQSERAHAERRLGNTAQAAALYSQSILNWQAIGNSGAVAHELECFAFIAIAHSQARRAARLLGAAEALRASLGSTMTWQEQAEYDHHLATLRAQMDEAALAKGWAAGQALTMEQAIAFALEEPTGSTTSHPASGSASTQSA